MGKAPTGPATRRTDGGHTSLLSRLPSSCSRASFLFPHRSSLALLPDCSSLCPPDPRSSFLSFCKLLGWGGGACTSLLSSIWWQKQLPSCSSCGTGKREQKEFWRSHSPSRSAGKEQTWPSLFVREEPWDLRFSHSPSLSNRGVVICLIWMTPRMLPIASWLLNEARSQRPQTAVTPILLEYLVDGHSTPIVSAFITAKSVRPFLFIPFSWCLCWLLPRREPLWPAN